MLQRRQFGIANIVNNMLDALPTEIWTSATTTFLDPAIGGGQFVKEIERRLREAGHSAENIKSRVFGYDSSNLRLRATKGRNRLIGTYEVKDFISENTHMKFDVTVMNPPYTDGTNGKATLWDKFISKAMDMSNTVAAVVPSSLAQSNNYRSLRKRINDNGLGVVEFLPSETFPGVTVETLYFITDNSAPKFDGDIWLDGQIKSIIEKIERVAGTEYYNKESILRFKAVKLTDEIGNVIANVSRHGHKIETGKLDRDIDNYRVVTSYMSNAKCHLQAVELTEPGTGIPGSYRQLIAKDRIEADNIRTYLKSNLCVALYELTKTSRSIDGPQTRFLPVVDFTRVWTNEEVYKHFGLTADDIAFLEENI